MFKVDHDEIFNNIKLHSKEINDDAYNGNNVAMNIIQAYRLYKVSPDNCSLAIMQSLFEEWINNKNK